MANTDIVTREDIGNGLAINANKLEADFAKVASKNDLLTKADLVNGKVPASQLPSFIDEIQEFPSIATFPITGQSDILYLALDTNKLYRWSGTAYVDLSALAGMPDFALNANVVHKTLDETIDGIKSFNSSIYAQDGLSLKNNNAPLLQTGRTILYSNASQFGFLNGNDKGAVFLYNNPNSLVYVLPSATGTLALLSDLTPYLLISTALNTYQTLANISGDLTASGTKYPSVNAVNTGLATKFNNPTGTVSQYIRGDGSIASFPFIPTMIWGNMGGTLSNQTDLQNALDGKFNNPSGTTLQYVRGDGSIALFPTPYGLLPTGGGAGQILTKVDGTDYNTAWMDNYALWTSVVRHEIKAGEAITKGQAVYISPIQDGTNMIVVKADYSQESTSSKTLGLVMQSLSNNQFGQVVTEGLLGNLNTIGANQGDPVWLGANGSLIYGLGNKPEAPNHLVFVGIVTRVNANNGEIFVKVQNGFELEELHNVKIVNKANNEVLAYEQSTGLWKNKAINTLIGYVPANDNNVLHLDGNETVGGNKTFTGATAIAGLFIDETFGYANIATHTQLKAHADFFHFNASSNNKGAKFIYGTVGQRIYSLPITDGVLALTSDIPTLSGLGGVPVTRTLTINGVTYDLSASRAWNLSAGEIATALGYTPLAVESDPIFVASPAYGITSLLITNWNTAYGWGNHAGLYSLLGHTHTFASLTAKPTTLVGYGITDSATSAQGANADTAFSWGNHALVGYLLASTASTLYQSKDADLTAIAGLAGAIGLLRKTALDTWTLDTNVYLTGITSGQVTTALGYTPVPNTRTITINGTAFDLSADRAWTIATYSLPIASATVLGGGKIGAGVSIDAGGVISVSTNYQAPLGFTPYNATNPNGYTNNVGTVTSVSGTGTVSGLILSGAVTTSGFLTLGGILSLTFGQVTTALGFTPYNATNPSGYISGITSGMVTTALGYTPYNSSNPSGYISGITSGMVTTALGYTPYNSSNPAGYITASASITGSAMSLNGYAGQVDYTILTGPANGPVIKVRYDGATANRYIDLGFKDGNGVYSEGFKIYNNGTPTWVGNTILHSGNYSSYALPLSGGINMTGSFGMNDSKLYLRGNGDNNHYLWNAADDWEELVAYFGTGFRILASNGTTLATFATTGNVMNISGNATTAGGLAVHTSRNDVANQIVRTDVNGYLNTGWINTPSGAFGGTVQKIYCSGDDYIRFQTPSTFIANLGLVTANSSPSFAEGTFGTTAGASNQGIQIRFANNTSGYGRIRFYENDANTQTIHCFSAAWQGGGLGSNNSAGGINIAGTAGVTFGSWNSCDAYIATGGTGWFRGTVYASSFRGNANQGGTGEAVHAPAGIYSTGNNWLYGNIMMNGSSISGVNTIAAGGLITGGQVRSNNNIFIDQNFGNTLVGVYTSTRYQGVFAMGDAYKLPADGTTPGSLYGLAWSHPNAGGQAGYLNDHGLLIMVNGLTYASISSNIWTRGSLNANSNVNATSGYFYGSGSIRCGDMWGGAGLYRPSGSMVFGIEDSDWIFSKAAVTQAYFAGGDGNLWMRWAGDWLSNLLAAKVNNSSVSGLSVNYANSAGSASSATTATRTSSQNLYPHAGTGMFAFYNWGGVNGGASEPNASSYTTGISVGSHPSDQSYGFQIANNMWNTGLWTRNYNGGFGVWYRLLDSGNYTQYTPSLTGSGASGTWGINISGNANSANSASTATTATNLSGFDKTNPTFSAVYSSNHFRGYGDSGLYSQDYGGLLRRNTTTYGTWETIGYAKNGWGAYVVNNNYINSWMMNTSGDYGFFQENGRSWTLFFNYANNCWGIGTDNTYSGDGFRCIKYGSAQYGWTTWSDRRAKENISPIKGALDTVLGMRGVYYNYIKDKDKVQRVGFIAQELMEVLPQAVRYAEEIDEYNVNYDQIVSVLAEAMKEQNAEIIQLKLLVNQLINR